MSKIILRIFAEGMGRPRFNFHTGQDDGLLVLRVALAEGVQALGRALAERLALVIAERAGGQRRGRALPPQQVDERRQAAALADRRLVCFVVDC